MVHNVFDEYSYTYYCGNVHTLSHFDLSTLFFLFSLHPGRCDECQTNNVNEYKLMDININMNEPAFLNNFFFFTSISRHNLLYDLGQIPTESC